MNSKPPKKRRRRAPRPSDPPKKRADKDPRAGGEAGDERWHAGRWTATILLALGAFASAALYFVYPNGRGPGAGREVELALDGDESPEALGAKLAGAGLVNHPRLFAVYVRASGASYRVARGAHLFTDDLTPRELLARIERRGGGGHVKVVLPEGWTRFDIGQRLQTLRVCTKKAFLDATESAPLLAELRIQGPSAEGYLFPATYDLPQDSLADDVVRRLKAEFDRRYATLEERHASEMLDLAESLHWGKREVVILASMVEKEAVVDDERPIIAGVFVNRLRDPAFTPRLLQCDPTAGYGCLVAGASIPSCAGYTGKITHDLVADPANPYNTYKHEGLPPGPISSPGAKSLEAAMAPTPSRYFYFVAKGGGRHTFSETYGAHAAAIDAHRH